MWSQKQASSFFTELHIWVVNSVKKQIINVVSEVWSGNVSENQRPPQWDQKHVSLLSSFSEVWRELKSQSVPSKYEHFYIKTLRSSFEVCVHVYHDKRAYKTAPELWGRAYLLHHESEAGADYIIIQGNLLENPIQQIQTAIKMVSSNSMTERESRITIF